MSIRTMNPKEVEQKIFALIKNHLPDRKVLAITTIRPINTGWETEIVSFQVQFQKIGQNTSMAMVENLILRMYQNIDDKDKVITESNIMSFLSSVGYPVPKILFKDISVSIFNRPLIVMEKIDGPTLGEVLVASKSDKKQIMIRFCQLLFALHTLSWDTYLDDMNSKDYQNGYYFTDSLLSYLEGIIAKYNLKELLPYYLWAKNLRNDVLCIKYSVIHLDFHPYNIIVDKNDQYIVIDWSNGRIGDYRADLAWTLILTLRDSTYTYYYDILTIYETLRQEKIEQFNFFEVVMALRRLSDLLISLKYGADKTGMRPEAIDAMKNSLSHYARIYELLVKRTGIHALEIENILITT